MRHRIAAYAVALLLASCSPYISSTTAVLGPEPYYAGPFSVRVARSQKNLDSYCRQVSTTQQKPADIDGCYDHGKKEMMVKEDPYSVLRGLKRFFESGGKESYVFSQDDLGKEPYKIGHAEVTIARTLIEKRAVYYTCITHLPRFDMHRRILGCTRRPHRPELPYLIQAEEDPYVLLHEFIFHVLDAKSHD